MTASGTGREARHLALERVGAAGQARIAQGSVLVIGAGGIGCAALAYLAAAGVGRIVVSDFDTVDASNLGRQVLYGPADVGESKVRVATARLAHLNPDIRMEAIDRRLDDAGLAGVLPGVDVVLDGSDNFATRFQVNDACVAAQKTLITGGAIRLEGQLVVVGPDYATSPCYRCLYTDADESLESCAGNGVLGPVPGVVGALMAVECLKLLAGMDVRRGSLQLYDASTGDFQRIRVDKRERCAACA